MTWIEVDGSPCSCCFFAFGLVGPGCIPISLIAIIVLELQDYPGPPHGVEKKSFQLMKGGAVCSVLETRNFDFVDSIPWRSITSWPRFSNFYLVGMSPTSARGVDLCR